MPDTTIDISTRFPGSVVEIPNSDEWDRADALLREHGLEPLDRTLLALSEGRSAAPASRAILRMYLRHALAEAPVSRRMTDYQTETRSALALVGVEVPADVTVILDDADNGRTGSLYRINYGQLEAALDEHRAVTGESLGNIAEFESALGWY